MVFYGKDCQWYGRIPHREDVMKVWKDYTTEDAFLALTKKMNIQINNNNNNNKNKPSSQKHFLLEKKVSRWCARLHRITTESMKEIMKEIVDMAKNGEEEV